MADLHRKTTPRHIKELYTATLHRIVKVHSWRSGVTIQEASDAQRFAEMSVCEKCYEGGNAAMVRDVLMQGRKRVVQLPVKSWTHQRHLRCHRRRLVSLRRRLDRTKHSYALSLLRRRQKAVHRTLDHEGGLQMRLMDDPAISKHWAATTRTSPSRLLQSRNTTPLRLLPTERRSRVWQKATRDLQKTRQTCCPPSKFKIEKRLPVPDVRIVLLTTSMDLLSRHEHRHHHLKLCSKL